MNPGNPLAAIIAGLVLGSYTLALAKANLSGNARNRVCSGRRVADVLRNTWYRPTTDLAALGYRIHGEFR